jgi:hypothetical protein
MHDWLNKEFFRREGYKKAYVRKERQQHIRQGPVSQDYFFLIVLKPGEMVAIKQKERREGGQLLIK